MHTKIDLQWRSRIPSLIEVVSWLVNAFAQDEHGIRAEEAGTGERW
jgi:hypothetical protein